MILTPVGPVFFLGVVVLFVAGALYADRALALGPLLAHPWNLVLAVPLGGAGLLLIGWSVIHFLQTRGTPVPFNPPPRLVDNGPYAHARNPMLSGLFLALFGLGFYLGSVSLVLVFIPLFMLLNFWELKKVEEPELEKRLGQPYIDYRKRVPMFFPRIRRATREKEKG